MRYLIAIGWLVLAGIMPVRAADFSDPDWPCVQRKVKNMSQGLMWPHPIGKEAFDPAMSRLMAELANRLALRRTELQEAETLIYRFADVTPQINKTMLGQIFARIFERLDLNRVRVINGIGRYAREQTELSDKIEAARQEMEQLGKADAPDFDRMDALEEQLDWDERIYRDRTQSLGYLCETPVIIEKRTYAIAKLLEKHLP